MNDSEEPKWICLWKYNNFEGNRFPRLQKSENVLSEAVLVPRLEVKWGRELIWQWYLSFCCWMRQFDSSVMRGTKWSKNYASGTKRHNSQLWLHTDFYAGCPRKKDKFWVIYPSIFHIIYSNTYTSRITLSIEPFWWIDNTGDI